MLEWGIVLILVMINAIQTVYWSRMTHKLIDKLMSRNYAEYVQLEKLKSPVPNMRVEVPPEVESDEDLDQLNRTFGGLI